MSEPVVYLSTLRIKDGKIDEYRRFYTKLLDTIQEPDRDVVAFFAFGNADGTGITNVHVFPERQLSRGTWPSSAKGWACSQES